MLIGIAHKKSDGASGAFALEDAGKQFHLVGFFAWGCEEALSRSAACQFALNERGVDVDAGRKAVQNASHARAVAFAKGGEPQNVSESVHVLMIYLYKGVGKRKPAIVVRAFTSDINGDARSNRLRRACGRGLRIRSRLHGFRSLRHDCRNRLRGLRILLRARHSSCSRLR